MARGAWWRGTTPLRSNRSFRFDATPEEVWALMADVHHYRTWWSWLHELEATRLAAGEVWRCRVQPPLPYQVRFSVRLDQVVELQRVSGTVSGDVAGTASIELARTARGTTVHLVSSLVPRHPALRALSIVGGPMIRAGHDWVLDAGARDFDRRALSRRAHVRPRPHRSRTR